MSTGRRQPEQDRSACTPCRGTGKVISGRGGEPHEVPCPWCNGTGAFTAGHDAQAAPAEQAPAESAPAAAEPTG